MSKPHRLTVAEVRRSGPSPARRSPRPTSS